MNLKASGKTKAKGKKKAPASKADTLRQLRENAVENPADDSVDKSETIASDTTENKLATTEDSKIDILPVLSEEEKKVKAQEEDKRFRELEAVGRKTFAEMAFILRDFKAYELWRYVPRLDKQGQPTGKEGFKNFDSWLTDASPLGRSSGYAALRAAEKLLPLIPKKELEQMPRYSLDLLSKVPKMKLENPTIRKKLTEAAQSETKEELTKTIQQHAPEAHVEGQKTVKIDMSADNAVGDAFQAARDVYDCETQAEAIEVICVDWLDTACTLEQYAGMSNRQAWEAWKQSQNAEKTGKDIAEMQKENNSAA